MSEPTSVNAAIEAASNPKVATVVATATASIGAASKFELIQGALSIMSMTVGLCTALIVLVIQSIKLVRVWKAWKADKPDPEDFK